MPSRVCDTRPCDKMKQSLHALIRKDGKEEELIIRVDSPQALVDVKLDYCPFCGTRIDGKWAKEMKEAY